MKRCLNVYIYIYIYIICILCADLPIYNMMPV